MDRREDGCGCNGGMLFEMFPNAEANSSRTLQLPTESAAAGFLDFKGERETYALESSASEDKRLTIDEERPTREEEGGEEGRGEDAHLLSSEVLSRFF